MNELLLIDCMEYMKTRDDNTFDLAIVDPPYGVNLSGGRGTNGWSEKVFWDKARNGWNTKKPNQLYFTELLRVSNEAIIWGGNYFTTLLPESQCWIIWDKGQRNFSLADGEMAWTSFNKAMRIHTLSRAAANRERKIHPTQKPVKLYKWLLQNYAKPGDKLFDSHSGSGSFRIAAHDLGFDLVSREVDSDYYRDNETRFQNHIKQSELFDKSEYQDIIYDR